MGDSDEGGFRRRDVLKAVGLAGLLGAASDVTVAEPSREPGPRPNELLVGMESGVSQSSVESSVQDALPTGSEVVGRIEEIGVMAVELPDAADSAVRADTKQLLTSKAGVRYAEDNPTASYTPNDPYLGNGTQYAPRQVNAPSAWDDTLGSSDVTIAVIDGGIQYTHPDLSDVAIEGVSNHGRDFASADGDPAPEDPTKEFHGSHVAGIACGATDDGEGMAGISNCSLLCCRALGTDGFGSYFDIADAIVYAANQGAEVINMSLGGGSPSTTIRDALQYAVSNGSLPIAAAGNDSKEFGEQYTDESGNTFTYHQYPAEYPECMCVSAVDSNESFASFSSFGEEVDVTAPGDGVFSAAPQEYVDANIGTEYPPYLYANGTSMATPVVAGVAGLTFARHPYMSNDDVRNWIEQNATDLGLSTKEQGEGQVDADAVMDVPQHDHTENAWTGTSSEGWMLKLVENSGSGYSAGLRAESGSRDGMGIQGIATSGSGRTYGINGITFSNNGAGVRGKAPSSSGTTFGVLGVAESPDGKALQGTNTAGSGEAIGLEGRSDSMNGIGVRGRARSGSGENYGVYGQANSGSGYGVYSDGDLHVQGDFTASGSKDFVQTVSTDDGQKDVAYTAVEADRAQTETTGVATLTDGHATVDLPDHFGYVTNDDDDIVVQVTPHSTEASGPAVVQRSTDRITIEDLDGAGEYEVSYTIRGTREGYEDKEVVLEAGTQSPPSPSID